MAGIKVELNANEISNSTLAKLTIKEISKLGLLNIGIYGYKGTLKTRKKGYSTIDVIGTGERHFVGTYTRIEFIKIQPSGTTDDDEYVARLWSLGDEKYVEHWSVIAGCDFFR